MTLFVFQTIVSAFLRSRPAHHLVLLLLECSSKSSARCSVRFHSIGLRVDIFSSNRTSLTTLRLPIAPNLSLGLFLQIRFPTPVEDGLQFSLLTGTCIIHLHSLTLNERPAAVLPSRWPTLLIIPPTSAHFAPLRRQVP